VGAGEVHRSLGPQRHGGQVAADRGVGQVDRPVARVPDHQAVEDDGALQLGGGQVETTLDPAGGQLDVAHHREARGIEGLAEHGLVGPVEVAMGPGACGWGDQRGVTEEDPPRDGRVAELDPAADLGAVAAGRGLVVDHEDAAAHA
jgi:hypothetical protein